MKHFLFLFCLISLSVFGQDTIKNLPQGDTTMRIGPTFTLVQKMPKFKGDLSAYLRDNIHYPEAERKANITGTVFITFIVNKDGSISEVRVLKGVEKGPGLDAEALKVISAMPPWIPGTQNGNLVRTQMNLPINFELH